MKKTLAVLTALTLLMSGCARQSEVNDLKREIAQANGDRSLIEKQLKNCEEASRLNETKIAELQGMLGEIKEAAILNRASESRPIKTSKIEDAITTQLVEAVGKNLNTLPPSDWWQKHGKEEGFNRVGNFILALSDLQDRTTKANLTLTDERDLPNEAENKKDLLVLVGIAHLYDVDPDSAVWISKFWVKKSMISNQIYLNDMVEKYSRRGDAKDEQLMKEMRDEENLVLTTYFFDHWKEIREMVMDALISAKVKEDMKNAK